MKKNTIFRIAAVVLMCALVTACFASSTFARYTSQAEGTTAVKVANWTIKAGKDAAGATDIYVANGGVKTFDLTTTIKDSDGTSAEENVVAGKIAPGTTGKFDLYVENASEVDAEYTVTLDTTKLPSALLSKLTFKYYVDGIEVTTLPTATALAMNANDTVTVEWAWAYNKSDAENISDTEIGHAATDSTSYNVTAKLVVTQVD